MNTLRFMVLASALTLLSGCWPLSLHPLYQDDEGELVPGLEGTWSQVDGENVQYEFKEDAGRRGYHLTITPREGGQTQIKATVVTLGGSLFLDLAPQWGQRDVPAWYAWTTQPMHTIFRLELTPEGELVVTPIVESELTDRLKASPELLEHRVVEVFNEEGTPMKRLVLTAPTPQLRTFFEQHARDAKLFKDPVKLVRVEAAP